MARERSDCTERVRKAPCAWRASDPAALKVIGHVLEASQAGRPGFGTGSVDFCLASNTSSRRAVGKCGLARRWLSTCKSMVFLEWIILSHFREAGAARLPGVDCRPPSA